MAISDDAPLASGSLFEMPLWMPQSKAIRQREKPTADAKARREPADRLLHFALEHRLVGLVILHALVFASIYWLCYLIRFDGEIPPAYLKAVLATLPLIVLLKLAIFLAMGSHRGLWHQFTFADMTALTGTAALGSFALTAVGFLNLNWLSIPHSIIVMDCAGTLLVLGGLRDPSVCSARFFGRC